MEEDNVTLLDSILANRSYLANIQVAKRNLGLTGMLKVIMLRFGILKRIEVRFKGKSFDLSMQNFQDFWRDEVSTYNGNRIRFTGNTARFSYKGKSVTFIINKDKRVIAQTGVLINEQFFSEQYSFNDIRGKDVVDIGANIGDSPIYFALNGAKSVYAYEPFPYIYEIAKKNISMNRLEDVITLNNEAIGGKSAYASFPRKYIDGSASIRNLKKRSSMKKIHIITLDSVVKKYGLKNALLKSDCEGSEYIIFMKSNDETLHSFDEIIIEYHYGYLKLRARLEKAGFRTEVSRPTKMLHADGSKASYAGIMHAIRDVH